VTVVLSSGGTVINGGLSGISGDRCEIDLLSALLGALDEDILEGGISSINGGLGDSRIEATSLVRDDDDDEMEEGVPGSCSSAINIFMET
jgi:hypothetical protein